MMPKGVPGMVRHFFGTYFVKNLNRAFYSVVLSLQVRFMFAVKYKSSMRTIPLLVGVVFAFSLFMPALVPAAGLSLPKTGQTTSYATGDDGDLERGASWPTQRFTNVDGTTPLSGSVVFDQLTGLMWSRSANLPGATKTWQQALDYIASMNSGSGTYGYTDWRLPNLNELESLVNAGAAGTAAWLTSQGFTAVQTNYYWTSTTNASGTGQIWVVNMHFGYLYFHDKTNIHYVWPVRAGQ